MPRGDGSGPMGMGPMTGRAAGICAGYAVPDYVNPVSGCGFGFGRGFGLGRGMGFRHGGGFGLMRWGMNPIASQVQKPDPELEKQTLKNYAKGLETELKSTKKRLSEIEKSNK